MITKIHRTIDRLTALFSELGYKDGLLYLVGEMLRKLSNNLIYIIRYYIVAQPILFSKHPQSNGQSEVVFVDPDHP